MNQLWDFFKAFIPFLSVYFGALGIVRYDIKKLKQQIEQLEKQIEELKNNS